MKKELKMNIEKSSIAERLRVLRAKKNIKQTEMTKEIGIARQTLSMIERGEQFPTIRQIAALSDFFGVSIDYLVKGSNCSDSEEIRV
jgi:transcriptional regulator with XRE-family HTH domain